MKNNKFRVIVKKEELEYSPKFGDWCNTWLETYKKPFINQRSYKDIKNFISKITNVFGSTAIKEITTEKIQRFINNIPKNRTKERIETYFNAVLEKASQTNIIEKNPFKAVIKEKKGKYKNYALTYDEQFKLITALKNSNIEVEILLYLLTGARPNELPGKANIDFENNLINIYGTKNENAKHRTIEITDEFNKYLQEKLKNKEILNHDFVKDEYKKICNKIGINNSLLYRLRHTFASNHFALGTPAKQVSQWLGHSTISITLDTYTDIDKTISKEKIKNLYNNFYYITK